jgi:hypothetical protein
MNYWLDLFTGTTWDEFRGAGACVTGFREHNWKRGQNMTFRTNEGMSLSNDTELANSHAKLALLEKRYAALRSAETTGTTGDAHLRDVTMRSLLATMKQFREEIARYEARQPAGR